MSTIYTFRRIEKKYIINHAQYKALIELLMGYFHKDEHGFTRIFNIYFDNDANELINTSVQKPVYKEKLRLRSYHTPDKVQDAFLEIKKKFKGVVYKRRITVPYKDIESFLATNTLQNNETPHTYKEINYMLKHYSLYPKVLISYLREAYFSNTDPSLRITFDHDIKSRYSDLTLAESELDLPLLDDDTYIMEIKVAGAVPMFLSNILAQQKIYPSSFSKYGNIHKQHITGGTQNVPEHIDFN